ncbi:MAG: hypothetical protein WC506_02815 [Candidatus Micrarchaeia archaeon]
MRPGTGKGHFAQLAIFALAAIAMLFMLGCASISGNTASQIAPEINGSMNSSQNITAPANATGPAMANSTANDSANVSNSCATWHIKDCPDGGSSYTISCTDGYSKSVLCPSNQYGRDLTGIPSSLLYLSNFKCYWNIRDAYPYGPILDPFVICKSDTIGWEESCTCAQQIQEYVSEWGFPS